MIFKQWQQVLDGTKGQTRRPNFPYELAVQLWKYGWSYHHDVPWTWKEWRRDFPPTDAQIAEANRILAENIITLPAQPGRGKKAVGRIRITKIRRERLQGIMPLDIGAEGIKPIAITPNRFMAEYRLEDFAELWDSIYKEPYRWEDNPEIWVLDFERSEG